MPTKSTSTKNVAKRPLGSATPPPFNSGQQTILQLLRPLTAQQLNDIQQLIQQYLASQSDALGSQVWEEKGYTDADMDRLLSMHVRSPYRKP